MCPTQVNASYARLPLRHAHFMVFIDVSKRMRESGKIQASHGRQVVSLRSMQAVQYFSLSSLSDSEEFRGQFFSENNSPSDCNGGSTVTVESPGVPKKSPRDMNVSLAIKGGGGEEAGEGPNMALKIDCDIQLRLISGNFSSLDLPKLPSESSCRVSFAHAHAQKTWSPAAAPENPGLVIWLTKLNVACDAGHLEFRAHPPPDSHANASATAKRFCGKLEEVPPTQRHLYYPSTPQTSNFNSTKKILEPSIRPRMTESWCIPYKGDTSFPTIHILGSAVFSLSYELVDHCYNVTLTNRLDSFLVRAQRSLDCNFKIALPYGNQVLLSFHVNFPPSPSPAPDSALANAADQHVQFYSKSSHSSNFKYERNSLSNTGAPSSASTNPRENLSNDILPSSDLAGVFFREGGQGKSGVNGSHGRAVGFVPASEDLRCANLLIHYVETDGSWMFCADQIDYPQRLELLSTSSTVYLHFKSLPVAEGPFPVVLVKYEAVPIPELVERCPFGSVAVGHSCVSVVEERPLPWAEAEQECRNTGGHLLTILTQSAEETINRILINRSAPSQARIFLLSAPRQILQSRPPQNGRPLGGSEGPPPENS
ncbi:unnamed protein product [Bemisia tabaci]|uniref:C-type lectin domain-containing protein n=1 Tax=Bemisia tabaci TaxID=7038 RepID=A0A9P0A7D3_BEMTA|nr:unnamed protein product [Bemisia tabaci]